MVVVIVKLSASCLLTIQLVLLSNQTSDLFIK